MAQRKPIVGGNWKMNLDRQRSVQLAEATGRAVHDASTSVDVTLFPAFPYLYAVGATVRASAASVEMGAQDCSQYSDGAYTGEVSLPMLKDCGCAWVLVGHSERRHVIGETDVIVNQKLRAALDAGLDVVLCIGETLDQREAGQTDAINEQQLRSGLALVPDDVIGRIVIAYEPVWAIGTGKTATPADAQAAHQQIRAVLADMHDDRLASEIRIQYGGSVKPGNAPELAQMPDIDGFLVGGASLDAGPFAQIVEAMAASI
ncbi:MAG: triose-phosphate isomerase [Phycisphaeraceae bacterium]|nr:triose-phosphate isomerase [Phycisphaerales bacterium]MCB9859185.1 triose-phosphate isomerase [Phycisphaeraceae bacterium]